MTTQLYTGFIFRSLDICQEANKKIFDKWLHCKSHAETLVFNFYYVATAHSIRNLRLLPHKLTFDTNDS